MPLMNKSARRSSYTQCPVQDCRKAVNIWVRLLCLYLYSLYMLLSTRQSASCCTPFFFSWCNFLNNDLISSSAKINGLRHLLAVVTVKLKCESRGKKFQLLCSNIWNIETLVASSVAVGVVKKGQRSGWEQLTAMKWVTVFGKVLDWWRKSFLKTHCEMLIVNGH